MVHIWVLGPLGDSRGRVVPYPGALNSPKEWIRLWVVCFPWGFRTAEALRLGPEESELSRAATC